ncbi:DEAD/DEAH box helicase family protein [Persephonella sp.]
MFLDRYYNDRERFSNELNSFLEEFNHKNRTEITPFSEEDLKKLAFWMATGSGKTLIMHINYWQILKYSKNDWDNIILITPNEGLSKQHYEELRLSGILCKLYDGNIDNLQTKDKEILVIDIYKLTKEKKGEGVSVDISYFDGKNLVFIDEGHKGQQAEEQKWKRLREEIANNGFLFEYSATFGQVIGKNKGLLEEYSKAIIFDYSYKYFYSDGYGKDFYVYNIKEDAYTETQRDMLLTAGLLSFYEQLEIFEKYKEELRDYNIEKPLWIFVGSKVTGKGINSDVVRITQFLNTITNNEVYLKENIKKILEGKSGLIDNEGNDIFREKFEFIKRFPIDSIVEGIYEKIFGGKGQLKLYEIKNADGELGLKTSTAEKYFGVINVGKTSDLLFYFRPEKIEEKLKKTKKEKDREELEKAIEYINSNPNLIPKEDHLSQSLFFDINENNSHINILIGAKKFIEGWNSWRVSNMGLINMGKGEGPQIIQLFGRGVRLKGKDFSLKREENPNYKLKALQTLYIFGLNADYMNRFLKTIEQEEVSFEEIEIPIQFNNAKKWEKRIYTINTKEDFDFLKIPIKLQFEENLVKNIKIDLRPKIEIGRGRSKDEIKESEKVFRIEKVETFMEKPLIIPTKYFDSIDWDYVYIEIMNYKIMKKMFNLILDKEILKNIVSSRKYKIFVSESPELLIENFESRPTLKIASFEGIKKFQDIILLILKDYLNKFYTNLEKRYALKNIEPQPVDSSKHYHLFPEEMKIIVKIPSNLSNEIKEISRQLKTYLQKNQIPQKWENWKNLLVHFNNHLYTPLVIWQKNRDVIKSIPVKLNEGETKFVQDLKRFLSNSKEKLKNKDVFLLRNLSKRGVGFFIQNGSFYPDFILWICEKNKQKIIFLDPKGIRNAGHFNDEKIQFCTTYIKEIEKEVNKLIKKQKEGFRLELESFILSVSEYERLIQTWEDGRFKNIDFEKGKEEFLKYHILFLEDTKYLERIFNNDIKI